MSDKSKLEIFDNPYPGREYEVYIYQPEFTSLCPKTGHPDFGTIEIRYVPADKCIELKSLKLYLQTYRNDGVFYEKLTNQILDHLVEVTMPRRMEVKAIFTPRGGISTTITVDYRSDKC